MRARSSTRRLPSRHVTQTMAKPYKYKGFEALKTKNTHKHIGFLGFLGLNLKNTHKHMGFWVFRGFGRFGAAQLPRLAELHRQQPKPSQTQKYKKKIMFMCVSCFQGFKTL